MEKIPNWITDVFAAIIIGCLGFLAKTIVEKIKSTKVFKKERIEKLSQFKRHLDLSKSIFDNQYNLRDRLWKSLKESYSDDYFKNGFNTGFEKLNDQMTDSQKEDFQLIRGITKDSIKTTNEILFQFANENTSKSLNLRNTEAAINFDDDMRKLKEHLSIWNAKYNSIFLNNPKHCLVYIHDEKRQGPEFPKGIEQRIEQLIQEYQ